MDRYGKRMEKTNSLRMSNENQTIISKIDENKMIRAIWEELVLREKLENIRTTISKIQEEQTMVRSIVKEELTNLWNDSKIPTYKNILQKLTNLEGETSNKQIVKEESQPEMVPINAWRR